MKSQTQSKQMGNIPLRDCCFSRVRTIVKQTWLWRENLSSNRGATHNIQVIFHPQLCRTVCKQDWCLPVLPMLCHVLAWMGKDLISMKHQRPSLQFLDLWFIKHSDSLVKVPSDPSFFLYSYFTEQVLPDCLPGVINLFFLKMMHEEGFILHPSCSV